MYTELIVDVHNCRFQKPSTVLDTFLLKTTTSGRCVSAFARNGSLGEQRLTHERREGAALIAGRFAA